MAGLTMTQDPRTPKRRNQPNAALGLGASSCSLSPLLRPSHLPSSPLRRPKSSASAPVEPAELATPASTSVEPPAATAGPGHHGASRRGRDPGSGTGARVTKRSGVPVWLLVIAAIVPAVIVGIAVYFATSGGSDEDPTAAAGVVDGLMRLGQSDQSNISSYAGELPPDFSTEFPMYSGAKIVVSIAIASDQGTGYLIVMSTPDSDQRCFQLLQRGAGRGPVAGRDRPVER